MHTIREPDAIRPLPALAVPTVQGQRVVLATADGNHSRGWRAVSDVRTNDNGDHVVHIADEEAYWQARLLGATIETKAWPAYALWVE